MDFVMMRRKVREIMGRLIGKKVDDTFCLFPPFYTDCGKNITLGKNGLEIASVG